MLHYDPLFGYAVSGSCIGEVWLSLLEVVCEQGVVCADEGRGRLALPNVRIKSATQHNPDVLIHEHADARQLQTMLDLMFYQPKMVDCDRTPSFSPGAKSYFQRLQDGKMIDFVVARLSRIPESKKAVMVFPTYDDYAAVLKNPKDDYLPCLVSAQFRLDTAVERLNTTVNFRSMDVFQKCPGNLAGIAHLTKIVAEKLGVHPGFLDGLIVDAHVYENTLDEARRVLQRYAHQSFK